MSTIIICPSGVVEIFDHNIPLAFPGKRATIDKKLATERKLSDDMIGKDAIITDLSTDTVEILDNPTRSAAKLYQIVLDDVRDLAKCGETNVNAYKQLIKPIINIDTSHDSWNIADEIVDLLPEGTLE